MRTAPSLSIALATDAEGPALDAYLAARSDTCMMLRSNLHAVGLAWTGPRGALYQAQYVLGWYGGAVVGVAGHAWNGNVLVQADAHAGELVASVLRHSGRQLAGLIGAAEQVTQVRAVLDRSAARVRLDSEEILMSLSLDELVVPPALGDGRVSGRRARAGDRELLIAWRAAYLVETGQHAPGDAVERHAAAAVDGAIAGRHAWVVERDGVAMATCMHNARLPDAVQVGGVFTPPALRGRGHARAVVAASLLDACAEGATRAVLFTPRPEAVAAYRAIGFSAIGRFSIVLFDV